MKLTEIVVREGVVPSLAGSDRDAALAELLDAVVGAGVIDGSLREELLGRLLDREARGSTGFGRGVAVPHVKHPSIPRVTGAVGLSEGGIDFNALDKQPVHSVVMLLSPEDKPEEHLQAMEAIFKNLSKDAFRRVLRQAGSVDEVMTLLDEADAQQLNG